MLLNVPPDGVSLGRLSPGAMSYKILPAPDGWTIVSTGNPSVLNPPYDSVKTGEQSAGRGPQAAGIPKTRSGAALTVSSMLLHSARSDNPSIVF